MHPYRLATLWLFAVLSLPNYASAVAVSPVSATRTIAVTGQAAPGDPFGATFDSFGEVLLNPEGRVAFSAILAGTNVTTSNEEGIWSEDNQGLNLAVRSGDANGVKGGFRELRLQGFNSSGDIVYDDRSSSNFQDYTVWLRRNGLFTEIASNGTQAAGAEAGQNYLLFSAEPALSSSGIVAFTSQMTVTDPNAFSANGLWRVENGVVQPIALTGDPIPNDPNSAEFAFIGRDIGTTAAVVNTAGDTVFRTLRSNLNDPSGFAAISDLWASRSGVLEPVVLSGQPAPGLGPDIVVDGIAANVFDGPDALINDAGDISFMATIAGEGISRNNNLTLWRQSNGNLQLLARTGQTVGTDGNEAPIGFMFPHVMNANGTTAFYSILSAPGSDIALFTANEDSLELILRNGDTLPELSQDVTIQLDELIPLSINGAGQIALIAQLQGEVTGFDDIALIATDRMGTPKIIARVGDIFEVSPGDLRTIRTISFFSFGSGNEDGRPSALNDRGEIAFKVQFSDRSEAIVISSLVAIPEPPAMLLIGVSLVWSRCIRRDRRVTIMA